MSTLPNYIAIPQVYEPCSELRTYLIIQVAWCIIFKSLRSRKGYRLPHGAWNMPIAQYRLRPSTKPLLPVNAWSMTNRTTPQLLFPPTWEVRHLTREQSSYRPLCEHAITTHSVRSSEFVLLKTLKMEFDAAAGRWCELVHPAIVYKSNIWFRGEEFGFVSLTKNICRYGNLSPINF